MRKAMPEIGQHDGTLLAGLLNVIDALRDRAYRDADATGWHRSVRSAESFLKALLRHLRDEERVLFRAIAAAAPSRAADFDELTRDHTDIRQRAKDVLERIAEGDSVHALEGARALLRRLLRHIRREESVIRGAIVSLDARNAARLSRRLAPGLGRPYGPQ